MFQRLFVVGEGGFAFLRKSHGGCDIHRTVAKRRLSNPPSKYPYRTDYTAEKVECEVKYPSDVR